MFQGFTRHQISGGMQSSMFPFSSRPSVVTLSIGMGLVCLTAMTCQVDADMSRSRQACDVVLVHGSFSACFRNSAGEGISDATAILRYRGRPVLILATDDQGIVTFNRLIPGLYELKIENQTEFVRVWAEETAPPPAWSTLTMVQHAPPLGASGPYAAVKLLGPGGSPLPLTMQPEKFIDNCRIADIRILPPSSFASNGERIVR